MDHTLGEQACLVGLRMFAQIPSVSKVVIPFNELDPVTLGQAELIITSGLKIICTAYYQHNIRLRPGSRDL